jgi:hypothetical protein
MGSYDDLLKDPRWILKRKVIITRDEFKCTSCGSKENLQVHHTYYYKQKTVPWAYPDESLITLCEDCHHEWHTWHEVEYKDRPKKKVKFRNHQRRNNKPIILKEGFSYRKQKKQQRKQKKRPKRVQRDQPFYKRSSSVGIQERIHKELDKIKAQKPL